MNNLWPEDFSDLKGLSDSQIVQALRLTVSVNTVTPTFSRNSFADHAQQTKNNPQTHAVALLMVLSHFTHFRTKNEREKAWCRQRVCEVSMWNVIGSGVHLLR